MQDNILICTVGGSHQPILTAIRETAPGFVCFLCTDRDPATGRPGSREQIEGKNKPVVVRKPGGGEERLDNLPTLAGLDLDRFQLVVIPADDLDLAVRIISATIADLERRFPDALPIADYTGGTKTMTAALVLAALDSERVQLRLVTGARSNLVKVHDGTQASVEATTDAIRLRRAMAPYLGAWRRYAYGEAADGLARVPTPRDAELRRDLQIARDLSTAFDAWDRFDHGAARERLEIYGARIGKAMGPQLGFLGILASDTNPQRAPARLWDLWLNARRRAARGRYDDAVARLYRLLEWTAQWLLLYHKDIRTADIAAEQVPEGLDLPCNREGKRQAGLYNAWELLAYHLPQRPAGVFALAQRNAMRNHLRMRNESILAHGETPIGKEQWEVFERWMETAFVPMLRQEAKDAGLRILPGQLPAAPPW